MKPHSTIAVSFFMKDAYPLFNPSYSGVFGGAEVDLYMLSRELAKNNQFKITFFVGDYGQPDVDIIDKVTLVKLKFSDLHRYVSPYYKIIRRLYIAKALFTDSSDILVTKTASDTLGLMVLINKLLKCKKVVFKCGSDIDADIAYWKQKNLFIYYIYKLSLKFVDAFICQTRNQQVLLDAGLAARSSIIKNGFPLHEGSSAFAKEHILWVSRYDYMKQPELFIRLARAMPGEQFVMIMPGAEKIPAATVAEIGKTDNLTFIDNVPFHAIQDYFNRAKCFVNTSSFEGFPNTFIQAFLGATPILSFYVNPDRCLDTYGLGCFCNGNLQEAVAFINSLDEETIKQYGNHARQYAAENHNIAHITEQYRQLFIQMAC